MLDTSAIPPFLAPVPEPEPEYVGFLLSIPAGVRILDLETGFAALAAAVGCGWECTFNSSAYGIPNQLHLYPEDPQ